jgi:hypothetical protein
VSLDASAVEQIESVLGIDFCSYCTASSKEELAARFKGEGQLSPTAEEALQLLSEACSEAVAMSAKQKVPVDLLLDFFGITQTGHELPLANGIRKSAGGELYEPSDADPLAESLQRLAVNVFPLYLIPPTGDLFMPVISLIRPLMSSPISSAAVEAILNDEDLKRLPMGVDLIEGGDSLGDETRRLLRDARVHQVIEVILTYAFNSAIIFSLKIPTVEDFCREVRHAILTAKKLIQGHRVLLPVAIGLANVRLPDATVIDSEVGRIAEYSYIYDRWIPGHLRKRVVDLNSEQGQHRFARSGNMVLHTKQKSRLSMTTDPEAGQHGWMLHSLEPEDLPTRQTIACLAATLGIDHDPPIGIDPTWRTLFSPVFYSPLATWKDAVDGAMAPLHVLSPEEVDAWKNWIHKVKAAGLGSIDIAVRRIQSAIAERTNAVDRFVDSVIAWENLFGGAVETRLRISSSFAWLLGTDANHRFALQEEIMDLYILRNQVVHGAKNLSESEAAQAASSTLRIGIAALRKLYDDHPQLIEINAERRSRSIMIQRGL